MRHGDAEPPEGVEAAMSNHSRGEHEGFGGQRRVKNLLRELNEEILQAKKEREVPLSPSSNNHSRNTNASYVFRTIATEHSTDHGGDHSHRDSTSMNQTQSMRLTMSSASSHLNTREFHPQAQINHMDDCDPHHEGSHQPPRNTSLIPGNRRQNALMREKENIPHSPDGAAEGFAVERHRKEQRAKALLATLRKKEDSKDEERKPLVAGGGSDSGDDDGYSDGHGGVVVRDSIDAWNREAEKEAKVLSRALHEDAECMQELIELDNMDETPVVNNNERRNVYHTTTNTHAQHHEHNEQNKVSTIPGKHTSSNPKNHISSSSFASNTEKSNGAAHLSASYTDSSSGTYHGGSRDVESDQQFERSRDESAMSSSSEQQLIRGGRVVGGGPSWDVSAGDSRVYDDDNSSSRAKRQGDDQDRVSNTHQTRVIIKDNTHSSSNSSNSNSDSVKINNGATGQNKGAKGGSLVSGYLSGMSLLKNSLAILREDLGEEVHDMRAAQGSIKQLIS
jgi:hypothetical protein